MRRTALHLGAGAGQRAYDTREADSQRARARRADGYHHPLGEFPLGERLANLVLLPLNPSHLHAQAVSTAAARRALDSLKGHDISSG